MFLRIDSNINHNKKNKILKKFSLDSAYITDEVSDIEECQKVGIDVYAVTWGLDNKKDLIKASPISIFEKFEDIKEIY